jgi:hypothetical protein
MSQVPCQKKQKKCHMRLLEFEFESHMKLEASGSVFFERYKGYELLVIIGIDTNDKWYVCVSCHA